jgi:hypothetical protein
MDEESLAGKYLEMLETLPNPGLTLTKFLFEIHDKEFNSNFIGRIGKLVKIYGKITVFNAICETAFVEDFELVDPNKIGLIRWFCQQKLENKAEYMDVNLKSLLAKKKKELPKRKLKVRSPFV